MINHFKNLRKQNIFNFFKYIVVNYFDYLFNFEDEKFTANFKFYENIINAFYAKYKLNDKVIRTKIILLDEEKAQIGIANNTHVFVYDADLTKKNKVLCYIKFKKVRVTISLFFINNGAYVFKVFIFDALIN